jgi:hypothetical protein
VLYGDGQQHPIRTPASTTSPPDTVIQQHRVAPARSSRVSPALVPE